jgi:CRISPR/Cas system-associated exonuclease Cas4 (RecB family)
MHALTSWSFSRLMSYESCPMRVKLRYIDKMPEPPLPPDNPMERGNRIHNCLENYIKGTGGLHGCEARAIDKFVPMLDALAELHANDQATAEQDWLFDSDWNVCSKDGYWLWSKLDYFAKDEANNLAVIGDWKSGKSQYKVVEHMQQTQLYAAIAALREPWIDKVITEIAYVDEGHIKTVIYTRDEALAFVGRFQKRVDRMLNDTLFRPNPNKQTCRFCPYSPRGTGACAVGV